MVILFILILNAIIYLCVGLYLNLNRFDEDYYDAQRQGKI